MGEPTGSADCLQMKTVVAHAPAHGSAKYGFASAEENGVLGQTPMNPAQDDTQFTLALALAKPAAERTVGL